MADERRQIQRRWLFTLNNPNRTGGLVNDEQGNVIRDETEAGVCAALQPGKGFRYLVFQLEQGENGTPHYQGPHFNMPLLSSHVDVMDRLCRV